MDGSSTGINRILGAPAGASTPYYGHYEDQPEIDLYERMVREVDPAKQRALMRQFEKCSIRKRTSW